MAREAETGDIRSRLGAISEELADMALDCLRQAVEEGGKTSEPAALERRLTRARRAVDKAAAILGE
ncbi:MAG: hypothetical protein M3179_03175 [Actinomycetota bacterium]|nr:hypothetical protein [Actinomycetota bacterium]